MEEAKTPPPSEAPGTGKAMVMVVEIGKWYLYFVVRRMCELRNLVCGALGR